MDYFPEILQVIPTDDYKVYLYFDDGTIRLYDAKELVNEGVFTAIKDIKVFKETCTVLNNTLAWDIEGTFDEYNCLDLDPIELYNTCPKVDEPEELFKKKG